MITRDDILGRLTGNAVVGFVESLGCPVLRSAGGEHFFRCPFHDDTDPSCSVFTKDGGRTWAYKCHPCGAGGTLFDFAAKIGGIGEDPKDYPKLLAFMAERLGIVDVAVGGGITDGERAAAARKLEAQREADRARQERYARKENEERARQITAAGELWGKAKGNNTTTALRYFWARGIELGALPPSIRYTAGCYRKYYTGERIPGGASAPVAEFKPTKTEHVPAVLCGAVTWDRIVTCVQRIYIDPASLREDAGGVKKISYGEDAKGKLAQKQTIGTKKLHAAVRLGPRTEAGVLILCEGVETGLAIQAAVGANATVWALVDVEVMKIFRLHPSLLAPEIEALYLERVGERGGFEWPGFPAGITLPEGHAGGWDRGGGWVRKVIVAGDLDAKGAGQAGARRCGSNLLEAYGDCGLDVGVALPSHALAPELVTEDGKVAA